MYVGIALVLVSYVWLIVEAREQNSDRCNFGLDVLSLLSVLLYSVGNLQKTWIPLLIGFVGIGVVIFYSVFPTPPQNESTSPSPAPVTKPAPAPAAVPSR